MRKILYLVTDANPATKPLVPEQTPPDQAISIVLLQDAVRRDDFKRELVYALSNDVESLGIVPSCPLVSYHDLLRMIFDADAVVAL